MTTTRKLLNILRLIPFLGFILAIQSNIFSSECKPEPFFEKVPFVGAVGENDWADGWTNYIPSVEKYASPQITIEGNIMNDYIMYSHKTYLLKGKVYVAPGVTLHIQPGTVIRGDKNTNATLIISRGAQIRSMGTVDKPVVFTSNMPENLRHKGDWGGIIILGQSTLNRKGGKAVMEGDLNPKYAIYGGDIEDDNSGIIQYTRIEFAGRKIDQANEINGLSLAAVGSRTKLDHIQVSYSNDDSFEFYGGTVNAKHLISFKCQDDDFDICYGYRGNLQFGIALRHPRIKDFSGSNGIEIDSYASDDNPASINDAIKTDCKISNFTIVSPKSDVKGVGKMSQGIKIGEKAFIDFHNSVILGFNYGILVASDISQQGIISGQSKFENNFFVGSRYPIGNSSGLSEKLNNFFVNPNFSNFHYVDFSGPLLQDPYNLRFPKFFPAKESKLLRGSSFSKLGYDHHIYDSDLSYIGAFKAENDWMHRWTNFIATHKQYPNVTKTVSGSINSKTVWDASKTYLLKGIVRVNAELIIKEGTVIKGDKATKATLLIGKNGKLVVNGTKTKPVVFTSNEAVGKRKAGDWGGVVILNESKVNDKFNNELYKSSLNSLPGAITFGGKNESFSSGKMSYCRIEFAGAKITAEENSALTLAGVSCFDIDHLQISYSAGNGIKWIGGKSNAKNVISSWNSGDDFRADYGYSGIVRYGVVLRDPLVCNKDAYAIESNGASSEANYFIRTIAQFKNFTIIGPIKTETTNYNQNYMAAVYIKNNSSLSIDNSIINGFRMGIAHLSDKTDFAIRSGELSFKNNLISCIREKNFIPSPTTKVTYEKWLDDNNNKILKCDELKLTNPFDLRHPKLNPMSDSPALSIE